MHHCVVLCHKFSWLLYRRSWKAFLNLSLQVICLLKSTYLYLMSGFPSNHFSREEVNLLTVFRSLGLKINHLFGSMRMIYLDLSLVNPHQLQQIEIAIKHCLTLMFADLCSMTNGRKQWGCPQVTNKISKMFFRNLWHRYELPTSNSVANHLQSLESGTSFLVRLERKK